MSKYRYNTRTMDFCFCPTCGCTLLEKHVEPENGIAGLNARCFVGVDLDALRLAPFDGRNVFPLVNAEQQHL